MIQIKNRVLERTNNRPIVLDAFYAEEKLKQPIVILCHGYKGFKDWGAWNIMSKLLANEGICLIKFNFSHNGGTVENPIDFPDLEAFGQNNYSKELNDLSDVIGWTQHHFNNNPYVDINNIILIGHSRGGGIVLLKAKEDDRVKKVVTLAGVSDFESRFGSPKDIELWRERGVKYVINGRTKQKMPHYYQFYEDFLAYRNQLNIRGAAEHIKIPHLIIHGDKDTSVNVEEALNLHKWNPKSQLEIIPNADHVFNTKHPWDKNELSDELKLVTKKILEFIT
ncbi:alpha/beta hydrolase family protein [uncultured Winogradskyella sp.]|uniref:alpha/beta hydrolase family protein n=1 Tax=uncultured Winogradskyella sp. TaxID=395353 RepID=UPI0035182334